MAYRPYPVAARALRQVLRRHRNETPAHLVPAQREPQTSSGTYVLSTRRER